ncbi:GNAT family N-acetyltransferase [Planctomicrobium sp. SH527]|uniref:GNAT family N-acetyltransferase n=1 Tax=Planctomicrobium sp. SH527 TaxID=3448123 RepID=UPI003F5AE955
MNIEYHADRTITPSEFIDVLRRSTLAERRPIENADCIELMLQHASVLCTAWDGAKLVGVARSVTDFAFCCYLSDLAVDQEYQNHGIGRALIELTQTQLKETAKIILLAAPKAVDYYPKLGFEQHPSAWTIDASSELTSN